MEYNKSQFHKTNDKKVLHKIKKHWVVISAALLMAIGGEVTATHITHAASVNNNNDNQSTNSLSNLSQVNHSLTMRQVSDANNVNSSAQSNSEHQSNEAQITSQASNLHRQILLNAQHTSDQNSSIQNYKNTDNSNQQSSSNNQSLGMTDHQESRMNVSGTPHLRRNLGDEASQNTSRIYTPSDSSDSAVKLNYITSDNQIVDSDFEPFSSDETSTYPLYQKLNTPPKGYYFTGSIRNFNNIPKSYWVNPNDKFKNYPRELYTPPSDEWMILDVNVAKDRQPSTGRLIIVYERANGQGVHMISTEGTGGSRLSPNDQNGGIFKNTIPAGYDYVGLTPGEKNPTNLPLSGHKEFYVIVAKNSNYKPNKVAKRGRINVNYIDSDNNQVGQDVLSDNASDAFDITPYEASDEIPQGYQFSSLGNNVPSMFNQSTQTADINVTRNSNPINNNGYINVTYNDVTNGGNKIVATSRLSNGIGTPFDIKTFEGATPNGYTWNGHVTGNVPTKYTADSQTIGIDVVESQNVHHETVKYIMPMSDGAYYTVRTFNPVADNATTPIDYDSMNQTVKNMGYQVIQSDTNDHLDKYIDNGTSTLYVKKIATPKPQPKPSPQKGVATIVYEDSTNNNAQVGTQTVSDLVNNPINYTPYTTSQYVPSNYTFVGYGPHTSTFSTNPSTDYLYVKPIVGTINVQYVNNSDPTQVITSQTVNGNSGQPFNVSNYEHNLSLNGKQYQYENVGNGANVNQFSANPKTIEILMEPIVVRGTVTLNYSSSDGRHFSKSFTSDAGQSFDPSSQVMKYIPGDYQFDSYTSGYKQGQGPVKFAPNNNQVIDVKISKKKGTINVTYVASDTGKTSKQTLQSDVGNSFDPMTYAESHIPDSKNYKFGAITQGSNIKTYGLNNQNLVIRIDHRKASDGTINVSYFDVNTNKRIGQPISLTSAVKSNFNQNAYIGKNVGNNEPGYHFVKVISGNNIGSFSKDPQDLIVGVAHDQGTISINYVDNKGHLISDSSVKPVTLKEDSGAPFNGVNQYLTNYQDSSKDNYVFDHVVKGNNIDSFSNGPQNIVVQLDSNPTVKIQMLYFASDGSRYVGSASDVGRTKEKVDYTPYIISKDGKMPKDYSFAGYGGQHGQDFGDSPTNTIYVNQIPTSSSAATPNSKSATPSSQSKPTSSSSSQPTPSSSSSTPSSSTTPSSTSSSTPSSSTTPSGRSSASSSASSSTSAPSSSSSATPSSSTVPSSTSSNAPSSSTTPSGHSSASSSASSSTSAPSSSSSATPSSSTVPSSTSSSAPSSSTTPSGHSSASSSASSSTSAPSSSSSTTPSSSTVPSSTSSSTPSSSTTPSGHSSASSSASSSTSAPSSSSSAAPSSSTVPSSTSSSAPSSSTTPSGHSSASSSASSSTSAPSSSSSVAPSSSAIPSSASSSTSSSNTAPSSSSNSSQPSSSNVTPSSGANRSQTSVNSSIASSISSAVSSAKSSASAASSKASSASRAASAAASTASSVSAQASSDSSIASFASSQSASMSAVASSYRSAVSSAESVDSAANSAAHSASQSASIAESSANAASARASYDRSVASSANSQAASYHSAASSISSKATSESSAGSSSAASSDSSKASNEASEGNKATSTANSDASTARSASQAASEASSTASVASSRASSAAQSASEASSIASTVSSAAISASSASAMASSIASFDSVTARSASSEASVASVAASTANSIASSASSAASVANSSERSVDSSASSADSSKSVAPQIITSTSTSIQYVPIYEPASGSSQTPIDVVNVPTSAGQSSLASTTNQPSTTINYVDRNGNPVTSQTVAGTNPDMSQYTQNVPSGYRFDRILGTGSLANGNQLITIQLSSDNGPSNSSNNDPSDLSDQTPVRHSAQPSDQEPTHNSNHSSDDEPNDQNDHSDVDPNDSGSEHENQVDQSMDPINSFNHGQMNNDMMANGSVNGDNEPSSTAQNRKLPQTGEASEDSKVSLGFILLALSALIANLGHAMDRRRRDK